MASRSSRASAMRRSTTCCACSVRCPRMSWPKRSIRSPGPHPTTARRVMSAANKVARLGPLGATYNRAMAPVNDPHTEMRALIKQAPGAENVALGSVPRPTAGPGEVVIEVFATGICGTDLHIQDDEFLASHRSSWATRSPVVVVEAGAGAEAASASASRPRPTSSPAAAAMRVVPVGATCASNGAASARTSTAVLPRMCWCPCSNLHEVHALGRRARGALYEPLCMRGAMPVRPSRRLAG